MILSETRVYITDTKDLEDEAVFQELYQTVSKERQAKIDRLRFPNDKRLSLAAAILLKKVLLEHGILEYAFSYGENGKPYLKEYPEIKFNLSHSGERVMCVISGQECGCDVEKSQNTDFKVAEHFFAEQEKEMLKNTESVEEKKDLFYRLWTLKESFLKSTGLGMRLSMKDFYFNIKDTKICVCQNVDGEQYYFREYDLQDGYKYAVCSVESDICDIVRYELK